MGKRARPRPAPAAAARGRRKILRKRAGSLHGRVIQPGTAKRYRVHVKEFFRWCARTGRTIPTSAVAFDALLCAYAEELWEEGDSKSVLANTLSGLTYFTISLKGKLPGALAALQSLVEARAWSSRSFFDSPYDASRGGILRASWAPTGGDHDSCGASLYFAYG